MSSVFFGFFYLFIFLLYWMYPTAVVGKQSFLQLVLVYCLYGVTFQIKTNKGAFVIIFFICRDPVNTASNNTSKVNNRSTRTRCEICSKLTIKALKRCQWCHSGVFIINFEYISHLVLVFLLFTLSRKMLTWNSP